MSFMSSTLRIGGVSKKYKTLQPGQRLLLGTIPSDTFGDARYDVRQTYVALLTSGFRLLGVISPVKQTQSVAKSHKPHPLRNECQVYHAQFLNNFLLDLF